VRRVWHPLDGRDAHAMSGGKLDRAEGATWCDPFVRFRIERQGDPHGQVQSWRADLSRGTAVMVRERPLGVDPVPEPWDAELASPLQADPDDPPRLAQRAAAGSQALTIGALWGVSRVRPEDAARLREALNAQLRGEWVRDEGWWARREN